MGAIFFLILTFIFASKKDDSIFRVSQILFKLQVLLGNPYIFANQNAYVQLLEVIDGNLHWANYYETNYSIIDIVNRIALGTFLSLVEIKVHLAIFFSLCQTISRQNCNWWWNKQICFKVVRTDSRKYHIISYKREDNLVPILFWCNTLRKSFIIC